MRQAIVILSALCIALCFYIVYQAKQAEKQVQIDQAKEQFFIKQIDSSEKKISLLQTNRDSIQEKLNALAVDKGYTEIELNRVEANIKSLLAASKEVRIKKDTIKIIQNCDSIIEAYADYFPVNTVVKLQADSINNYYYQLLTISDSIVGRKNAQISIISTDNSKYKIDNANLTSQNRQLKKTGWIMLGVGFIAGILTTIIK